ncbi:MAG: hypothetical protein HQK95_09010 [Nitrospirae bacterium]|nr:hypothetical protein [Nitrospirota bacterium]
MTDVSTEVCTICQKRQDDRHISVTERLDKSESDMDELRKYIVGLKDHINEKFNKMYLLVGSTVITLLANIVLEIIKRK